MRGGSNLYDEPQKGVFETYDEPELPNEGACLGYMMHRCRQKKGARVTYMLNRIVTLSLWCRAILELAGEPSAGIGRVGSLSLWCRANP